MRKKIIYMSVTNDVVNDQRVIRMGRTLRKSDASVTVIGRYQGESEGLEKLPFRVIRFKLLFQSGPLFYACFNIRIFFYLLFRKIDILVANDLDTLLPSFLISKIRGKKLVYDSHEYFTGIPEIQNRKFVRWVWKRIEKWIFPRLKYVLTVTPSIAELYHKIYGVNVETVKNFPVRWEVKSQPPRDVENMDVGKKIIILQGTGINIDRGAEEAVEAMIHLQDAVLWIIGCGYVVDILKRKVMNLELTDKVRFFPRMPYEELMGYTSMGHLGLSLDKDTNLNYRLSLPNKLFDYVQAGIPVLVSDLQEVGNLVREYGLGEIIESHDPRHIAAKIQYMLSSPEKRREWKENLARAAKILCWENEEKKLIEIYKRVGLEFL